MFEFWLMCVSGWILIVYGYIGFKLLPPVGTAKMIKWFQIVPMVLGAFLILESLF